MEGEPVKTETLINLTIYNFELLHITNYIYSNGDSKLTWHMFHFI